MRITLALGGNALGNSPEEQLELVKETAKSIVDLVEENHEIIIVHGNGPQVGMINLAMEYSSEQLSEVPTVPLTECGAMSQGYIGYHLQNAIKNEFESRHIEKDVCTIVTQTVVDKHDPAFTKPSKPIGSFYSKEKSFELMDQKGYTMVEDSGRGYRRVVPSPLPIDIVEKNIILELVESGKIVIAAGGGGIPVIKEGNQYHGVAAVIDKDYVSAKVAEIVSSDILFILTAVDKVAINFGRPNQKSLDSLTVMEARKYLEEGQFGKGSMQPKIEAALRFVSVNKKGKAIIAALQSAKPALKGETGTYIIGEL